MYNEFAAFYDRLMQDADYERRSAYIRDLFIKYDKEPTLLLDLACGTGGFSNEFARMGISVIGVDVSEDMLCIARENSAALGQDVLYLCQDATSLDLYGTVDGAVCCLDSLNHITDYNDFCKAISRVSLFLEKDRLFIFDVNTVYKHESVLANNTTVIDEDDLYCVWSNKYNPQSHTTNITLDFFEALENGQYERYGEEFCERAYTSEEIGDALTLAGLEIVEMFEENTYNKPTDNTERIIYVTRKV